MHTRVEAEFWEQGLTQVAGLDEAGRGAWAGPVYAAAVVFDSIDAVPQTLDGIRDSKELSPRRRAHFLEQITALALAVGVGHAEPAEIDQIGIVPATRLAMRRAVDALSIPVQALVIDYLRLPTVSLPQRAFAYADSISLSVAAAGIVAKVNRDAWMVSVADEVYPGYGFAGHKGYGTRQHRESLDKLGVTPIHRRTFRPVMARLPFEWQSKTSTSER